MFIGERRVRSGTAGERPVRLPPDEHAREDDSGDMRNDLGGRVALVIGGSRGIGAGVAARLAEDGADVVLTFQHRDDQAAVVVKQIEGFGRRGMALRVDSADPEAVTTAVDRTVAEFGRLDILVNNAAVFFVGPVQELGRDEFDRMVAVNVRAPFLAAKAEARHMGAGGRIITIGSNMVERTVFPGFSLYSMSKTALVGLTKGLSRDLGPRGITANLVNPGPIDTDMNPADGPAAATIRDFTALGRYGTPAELAAAVAFLAGDGARYVTGASINVDGGFTV